MHEYTETVRGITLICLDEEARSRGCGYWYTVTASAFALTAFDTEAGVARWAEERGLTLPDGALSHRGQNASYRINGQYRTTMIMTEDPAEVEQAPDGIMTRTLSNGDYVVANIVTDPDGIRRVRTLNPNVKTRKVYNYRESSRLMGGAGSSVL